MAKNKKIRFGYVRFQYKYLKDHCQFNCLTGSCVQIESDLDHKDGLEVCLCNNYRVGRYCQFNGLNFAEDNHLKNEIHVNSSNPLLLLTKNTEKLNLNYRIVDKKYHDPSYTKLEQLKKCKNKYYLVLLTDKLVIVKKILLKNIEGRVKIGHLNHHYLAIEDSTTSYPQGTNVSTNLNIMFEVQPSTDFGLYNRNEHESEEENMTKPKFEEEEFENNTQYPYEDAEISVRDVEQNHEPKDHYLQELSVKKKNAKTKNDIEWITNKPKETSKPPDKDFEKVINTVFFAIFGLVIILASILILVILCRVLINYSECVRNLGFVRYLFDEQINNMREYKTLSKGMLNKYIPTRKVGKDLGKYENASCAICMCEYEEDSRIREISLCKHIYHSECLERWLKVKESCPLCKQGLSKHHLDPDKYGPCLRDLDNQLNVIIEEDDDQGMDEINADMQQIENFEMNLMNNFNERSIVHREFQENMNQFQQHMREFQRNMHNLANVDRIDTARDARYERIQQDMSVDMDRTDMQWVDQNIGLRNSVDTGFDDGTLIGITGVEMQPLRTRPIQTNHRSNSSGSSSGSRSTGSHSSHSSSTTSQPPAIFGSVRVRTNQSRELEQFGRIMDTMRSELDNISDKIIRLTSEVDSREQMIEGLTGRPEEREQIDRLTQEIETRRQEIQEIFNIQSNNTLNQ